MDSFKNVRAAVLSQVRCRFVMLYACDCLRASRSPWISRISVELVNMDGVEIIRLKFFEKAAATAAEPLMPSDFDASEPTRSMLPLDHLSISTPS